MLFLAFKSSMEKQLRKFCESRFHGEQSSSIDAFVLRFSGTLLDFSLPWSEGGNTKLSKSGLVHLQKSGGGFVTEKPLESNPEVGQVQK